jgi:hypothetical protein
LHIALEKAKEKEKEEEARTALLVRRPCPLGSISLLIPDRLRLMRLMILVHG